MCRKPCVIFDRFKGQKHAMVVFWGFYNEKDSKVSKNHERNLKTLVTHSVNFQNVLKCFVKNGFIFAKHFKGGLG